MIDAYYSRGSDSRKLFSRFEIAQKPDFETHLNRYNVIHIDVSSAADFHRDDLVEAILARLYREFRTEIPGEIDYTQSVNYVLQDLYLLTGIPFVIILDEWDCVVRNQSDRLTRYFGFTGEEVRDLCLRYHMEPDSVSEWYNGYTISGRHM